MANLRPLTPKQERFVREYLVDGNGTQAAIRAGCKQKSAKVTASKWLTLANVQAAIGLTRDLPLPLPDKLPEVTPRLVLTELLHIGTSDLAGAFDEKGHLLDIRAMPEHLRRAIASVKVKVDAEGDVVKEIKLWDKPKSLELLGKYLKLWTDKVEHEVGGTLAELIEESMGPPK